jgi:hypothetical protein
LVEAEQVLVVAAVHQPLRRLEEALAVAALS